MANRDVSNYRSSIQQVAPVEGFAKEKPLLESVAEVGTSIIKQNQEARITENFSKAQLDLARLDMQYQKDYEGDPFGGIEKLQAERKKIFDAYSKDISPFFKRDWENETFKLENKHDLTTEAWAYAQTKKNTVKSINEGIKANLGQATLDGMNYGNSDQDELGTVLNYAQSRQNLLGFGEKNLGAETTDELLTDYEDNYLKSFISGVSESNPLKALRIMERDDVKNGFKDGTQYAKMKEAVEARALQAQEIGAQKEVLNTLKNENSVLTQSLERNMSYAELQVAFEESGMSKSAQAFFLKANGYSKDAQGESLSASEKLTNKAALYSEMTETMAKESLSTQDISAFQDKIYTAMDNKTLSAEEGQQWINQLVAPVIDQKEKQFGTFSQNSWIAPDVGFSGVQKLYEENIAIPPAEGETEVGALTQSINDKNKVKLYDYYMQGLQETAASYGVELSGIKQLNKTQQRKLYTDAQNLAYRNFQIDRNPNLATLNDLPNQTFQNGKIIPGAAGARNIKPDVSAPLGFETYSGSDGYLYRKYPDGKYERVGKAP